MEPQNYFLADYNAVVDLANLQTELRQTVCNIDADSPFLCNFLSQEMLGRLTPETPMHLVQKTRVPITETNRFLVMRSVDGKPTKVTLTPQPLTGSELFYPMGTSSKTTLKSIMLWVTIALAVVILFVVIYIFMMKGKSKGYQTPMSPFTAGISNYQKSGQFGDAIAAGAKQLGSNIKEFANQSYF